jgi:hypothetical protein
MGNLTEIKTVFTIDLSPYMTGLKSMLTMTQQTGAQLKPLLNLEIDQASFSELEKVYDDYLKQVKASVPVSTDAAAAADVLGAARVGEGKVTEKATKIQGDHAVTLHKGKREALEAFGAISFLTQGMVQLASSSDPANKSLEKLNQGMSQGISAGFGLAGMLTMVNPALGGTAVMIGAVVAGSVALLSFLDTGTKKTKEYTEALKDFGDQFRGAATKDLLAWAANTKKAYEEAQQNVQKQEQLIKGLDAAAKDSLDDRVKRAQVIDVEKKKLEELTTIATAHHEAWVAVEKAVTASLLNNSEVRKLTRDSEIAAIRNNYTRQRAEATEALKEEKTRINESTASAEEKQRALVAVAGKYRTRIAEINQAEKEAAEQKEKEITAVKKSESDKRMRLAEEEARFIERMAELQLQEILNRVRLYGLSLGKSEEEISKAIHDRKVMAANAELKIITDKELRGEALDQDTLLKKQGLETTLTALAAEGAEMRIRATERERQAVIDSMQAITANISMVFGNLFQLEQQRTVKTVGEEKKRRQTMLDAERDKRLAAAETAEARAVVDQEFANKKEALDAEMDEKAKAQMRSSFQLQKAAQIANAMVATYSAAAAALAPPPLGLGPVFGPIVAATAIAAGLANIAVISQQEIPGLALGAKVTQPGVFQVGEAGTEWVVPENNFIQAFRDDLSPRLSQIMAPQINQNILASINGGGSFGQSNLVPAVSISISIGNYYGTEDHFQNVLKPVIEEEMRKAGIPTLVRLFRNPVKPQKVGIVPGGSFISETP